ncbi:MAG TPA: hypothetical protein VID26_02345 [Candidatus Limnocylindrales bacterium]|jgi:hypothetical protein
MALIEHSIESSAPPAHIDFASGIEQAKDVPQGAIRNRVEMTALDRRNELLRYAGCGGQVGLAPGAPAAEGADDQADASIVHGRIIATAPYRASTERMAGSGSTDPGAMRDTVPWSRPADH